LSISSEGLAACTPVPVSSNLFSKHCVLPYGLAAEHVHRAMEDFVGFLGFVNKQLNTKGFPRLESFLMPPKECFLGTRYNTRMKALKSRAPDVLAGGKGTIRSLSGSWFSTSTATLRGTRKGR